MKRRNFVKDNLMLSGALSVGMTGLFAQNSSKNKLDFEVPATFNLKYAPHLGMFKESAGDDPIDQLNFMADMGFAAFEDNGMKGRSISLQEQMASTMEKRGIAMGVFVAHEISWNKPNLTNGDATLREKFLKEIKESIEVAKRVNAKWMTVVPGHVDLQLRKGYQTANVVESLKQASALLEPHGLTMVLEPLNFRDHPGLFLTDSPQAFEICKAVDSPSCKILFDIYHQQIQEGNLIPNIDATWDEIAYFQVGDNPGRKEPTTGEINYRNVFKHIHSKGFQGIVGMEHGNSKAGKAGETAVIEAYKVSDSF
ncbi:Xylose isomerase domain-containing protein TIM barrel [Allomuricauda ruestringensis DSM 13258]|uniref:Xylose isomerase domain-containing protein TIM barrel n=1 Tax=Allomuricauda ruestringensis (strain DSM 13258 / CIP 107369 / LMG 19739 / B1) TaxID=886377 RepID=G2PS31_ALLRU|nr:TIM barrel protein [Allomuricauda ruestringensis]AEM69621.1 Xylose isomerase domain-containing protein TIM barrel [Allomuricauda ruestringensis DSM 13258]